MKIFLEILKTILCPFAILAKICMFVFRFLSKAYKNKQEVSLDIKSHEEYKRVPNYLNILEIKFCKLNEALQNRANKACEIMPNYLDLLFATKEANQDYDEINYLLYDKTQKKYCLVTYDQYNNLQHNNKYLILNIKEYNETEHKDMAEFCKHLRIKDAEIESYTKEYSASEMYYLMYKLGDDTNGGPKKSIYLTRSKEDIKCQKFVMRNYLPPNGHVYVNLYNGEGYEEFVEGVQNSPASVSSPNLFIDYALRIKDSEDNSIVLDKISENFVRAFRKKQPETKNLKLHLLNYYLNKLEAKDCNLNHAYERRIKNIKFKDGDLGELNDETRSFFTRQP